MTEKEKAYSRFTYLKRHLFELGQECQALVNSIHEETETFLTDKDFSTMDFDKIIQLAKELKLKQADYKKKVDDFSRLKETFSFTE